ncbi:MAG: hypothetical protein QM581_06360 [Pseudomonas sp.]
MSRSRRKTPVMGITTAHSDKPFKVAEHQRERSAVRRALAVTSDDASVPPARAFGSSWKSPKDGKAWFGGLRDCVRWMRK